MLKEIARSITGQISKIKQPKQLQIKSEIFKKGDKKLP